MNAPLPTATPPVDSAHLAVERVRHPLQARHLQVVRRTAVSPGFVRLTLAGPELAGFVSAGVDDHLKLILPQPGQERPPPPPLPVRPPPRAGWTSKPPSTPRPPPLTGPPVPPSASGWALPGRAAAWWCPPGLTGTGCWATKPRCPPSPAAWPSCPPTPRPRCASRCATQPTSACWPVRHSSTCNG